MDLRRGRLKQFAARVLQGKKTLESSGDAKLFLEALTIEQDRIRCVEQLISSTHGLPALQKAMRLDTSSKALNSFIKDFLQYLRDSELEKVCAGGLLQQIIDAIVDPSIFWKDFTNQIKKGLLGSDATACFAWLLLRLLSLPAEKANLYHEVARDQLVQRSLLENPEAEVRNLGRKILHVLEVTSDISTTEAQGPGGRHNNDFRDFRQIQILPTADELASTEQPFYRRAGDVEECLQSERLAMHIDNQFRLLREDMMRDLREELQIAIGSRAGRRKGLLIENLLVDGIDCDERQHWCLRLQCLNDLPHLPKTDTKHRKRFLVDNPRFLKHQSLACLIADDRIVCLVTINRKEDYLAENPPRLCIQLPGAEEPFVKAFVDLKLLRIVRLVQLNTAVFSYEPVLCQLQNGKHLGLKDEFLNWTEGSQPSCVPIAANTSLSNVISQLQAQTSFDLQSTLQLPKSITLDSSQVECYLAGLTQRVSLLQGPPGKHQST